MPYCRLLESAVSNMTCEYNIQDGTCCMECADDPVAEGERIHFESEAQFQAWQAERS